ncbi:MAG: tetraacyldisaccharide 4'-kinase [Planctomycetia bacterium]|nr:tetraacyldisaccharide 4'-kinase [Planctomycetia bacterium]
MNGTEIFLELIRGKRRGAGAALGRGALRLVEFPVIMGVSLRNMAWDLGILRPGRSGIPVISVGNLTVGGTGKTPLVAWLVEWFRTHGHHPAILSRGYGAVAPGKPNDEALELAMRLCNGVEFHDGRVSCNDGRFRNQTGTGDRDMVDTPGETGDPGGSGKNGRSRDGDICEELEKTPLLQNPDRVASVRGIEAGAVGEVDRIVLDDGFQHRRLARDLEIVLLDATEPFGYGHLLPRGLLREPVRNLRRVGRGVIILTRADRITEPERRKLRRKVRRYAPDAGWAELTQRPTVLIDSAGNRKPLTELAGRPVVAICGIGNPRAFLDGTLGECGVIRMDERIFPDHHSWTESERKSLEKWIRRLPERPAAILCTGKDIVRWKGTTELNGVPLLAVQMDLVWLRGQEELEQRLRDLPGGSTGI